MVSYRDTNATVVEIVFQKCAFEKTLIRDAIASKKLMRSLLVKSQFSSASTDDATGGDTGNPGNNRRVVRSNLQRPSSIKVYTEH